MKISITTLFAATAMASALFMSSAAFAQLSYADTLGKQVHVVCHVIRAPRSVTVNKVEVTVNDNLATVAVTSVAPNDKHTTKTFADRAWSVTESYDDYSDQIQYEASVDLTNDEKNFLLIQFYANSNVAHGVLQVGETGYDLLCQ
jgi:hypothetical protein